MRILDKRSMLYSYRGDREALEKLSANAFVMCFYDVVRESVGQVAVSEVTATLGAGEGLFIDTLAALGHTQEAVIEALEELVINQGIRVFVLDEYQETIEIVSAMVLILKYFRSLDVILVNRAA